MGLLRRTAIASGLAFVATLSFAHVVVEQKKAEAGTNYKATFLVGHGCAGGHATTALTVRFPDEVTAVKPMPKPGWTIEVTRVPIDKPYDYYGRRVTDRVSEITWKGASLPFDYYDEFVAVMRLPDKPGKLYFKSRQACGENAMEWLDVPEPGKTTRDVKMPAAELEIIEKKPVEAEAHRH